MLNKLEEALKAVPSLLNDKNRWDSLVINRRKPFTYRVFTQWDDLRICLHKFDTCDTHEAFSHPHPWPSAFAILDGSYKMQVGFSKDRESKPEDVMTVVMSTGSRYEIINPLTWHSVIPLKTTYTIMVNGEPWDTEHVAHKDIRTTKGKDLEKMPENELEQHLKYFHFLVDIIN